MVHSSTLTVATNGESLTCGGFSLGETICFGSHEFIVNCFGSLSFSPGGGGGSVPLFVGMTRSESLSPQAMIEDFLDKFYMPSSGGGGGALASPYPRGSAREHRLLPPKPHDGQKMLWPLRP
jgi:hypothetical protein